MKSLNFISGLPRCGSTLLAGILRQNPAITVSIVTPLAHMVNHAVRFMSNCEVPDFFDEARRDRLLAGMMISAYLPHEHIIDSNRYWTAQMNLIARLWPQAIVICCVRNLGWIVNSFERVILGNATLQSRMFRRGEVTVYDRAKTLMDETSGTIGRAYAALKEAFFGPHANQLVLVDYERLCAAPMTVLDQLYIRCPWPHCAHDFEHVEYAEPLFDQMLATPGLHSVSGPVRAARDKLVIPPDLYDRYADSSFWSDSRYNVRGVTVLGPPHEDPRQAQRSA